MEFSATQIAGLLKGTIEGDETVVVSSLAKIEEATEKTLTFLANPKYTEYIYTTGATIAIVSNEFEAEKPIPNTCTLIRVKDPYKCFASLLNYYQEAKQAEYQGVSNDSSISQHATLGENLYVGSHTVVDKGSVIGDGTKIHAQSYIGLNVKIGKNVTIFPGVKIYEDTVIGDDCTIHSGAIIGADGFGFAPNNANEYQKVAQIGNVVIGKGVEIGANTTIDRATLGSTVIKDGVKLDNLIQIAHNVEIGENTVIAAQTGVAGSTKIGKNCMIGGQVGISGHLKIGDEVKIAAQSGIGSDISDGQIIQGSPAFSIGDYKRSYVVFRNLPQLREQLRNLEKKVSTVFENIG